jgi:hypothetical protein
MLSERVGSGWVGSGWAESGWAELERVESGWAELERAESGRVLSWSNGIGEPRPGCSTGR